MPKHANSNNHIISISTTNKTKTATVRRSLFAVPQPRRCPSGKSAPSDATLGSSDVAPSLHRSPVSQHRSPLRSERLLSILSTRDQCDLRVVGVIHAASTPGRLREFNATWACALCHPKPPRRRDDRVTPRRRDITPVAVAAVAPPCVFVDLRPPRLLYLAPVSRVVSHPDLSSSCFNRSRGAAARHCSCSDRQKINCRIHRQSHDQLQDP